MDTQDKEYLLKMLEQITGRLGIQIRYDRLSDSKGGLCVLKGTRFLIIDAGAPLEDRIDLFKKVLSGYDLSTIYLPPAIREFLGR